MKRICPVCFHESMQDGVCAICGYIEQKDIPASKNLPPFTILHTKYILGCCLGQGGFGITYRAQNQQTGTLCCIKEYYPTSLIKNRETNETVCLKSEEQREEFEQGRQQFIAEVDTLKQLQKNIAVVNILDYFEENGTAYFVMELLDGYNLRVFSKLHTAEQNFRMALQMLLLIGSALIEIHRLGMIHGDVSPENIIITNSGEIKLIDFGAVSSFTRSSTEGQKKIYLKPHYAPYEQYGLKFSTGPWTDLYALAATFYFIVSGKYVTDAINRSKGQTYIPLCELSSLVSSELSHIIDKALAFDYHERYQTLTSFLSELNHIISPSDYNIDLGVLMSHHSESLSKCVQGQIEQPGLSEQLCSIEEDIPELKGLSRFFHHKKHRMAWLELTVQNGTVHGSLRRRWSIEPNCKATVGRIGTSSVMMPIDTQISRTHCEVCYNEKKQRMMVKDVSKYGTYLADGRRMTKGQEYILRNGDVFYVVSKKYRFKVVIES